MSADIPRLRMIAGPNGSGKSTIKSVLDPKLVVTYINPDEIEREFRLSGFLNLNSFGIQTDIESVREFFRASGLLKAKGRTDLAEQLSLYQGNLYNQGADVDSYLASVAADFLRHKLLEKQASFTFETVMSSHAFAFGTKRADMMSPKTRPAAGTTSPSPCFCRRSNRPTGPMSSTIPWTDWTLSFGWTGPGLRKSRKANPSS